MIWFDRTQRSVVVGCHQCGCREVCTTQSAADTWALDHIHRAHPGPSPEQERSLTASRVRAHRRR